MTARQRLRRQPNLTPRSSSLFPVHITTARRPDHIRLSALVRSRSTRFIVHSSSQLGHGPPNILLSALVRSRSTQFIVNASSQLGHAGPWPPETRSFSCHFGGVYTCAYTCVLCTHIRIYVCRDLVHVDSLGPPGVSSQLLGSHPIKRLLR